jgi:hypothetical protein
VTREWSLSRPTNAWHRYVQYVGGMASRGRQCLLFSFGTFGRARRVKRQQRVTGRCKRARLVFSRGFLTLPRRPSISLGHRRPLLLLTTATYLPKPLPTPPTDRSTTASLLPLPRSRSRSRARHPPLCPTPTHRPPYRPSPSTYAPLPAHPRPCMRPALPAHPLAEQ